MFCSWEIALSNSVTVLFLSVVASMEIKNQHYFQSDLLSVVYRLVQPGSMTSGEGGPMDLCPGKGRKGKRVKRWA